MSKKHFIELAEVLKRLNPSTQQSTIPMSYREGAELMWRETVDQLADFCQSQNPAFMRARWLGYINGENGKNGGKRA